MWLANMPIRNIIIGSATAPALGVRDMLFFFCLWCFYRLYLSLLGDLWDLIEDKLWANRAGVPLSFLVSLGNSLCKLTCAGTKKGLIFLWEILSSCSSQQLAVRSVMCAALSWTRTWLLKPNKDTFHWEINCWKPVASDPWRLNPFCAHDKSRRIKKGILLWD